MMERTLVGLAVAMVVSLVTAGGGAGRAGEMLLDIGGPHDGLFLGSGWYPPEGPYVQFGEIWRSRCRWATQGAMVRIPVFPEAPNTLTLRAEVGGGPEQRLRLFVNGTIVGEFSVAPDLEYRTSVDSSLLRGRRWATLRIETHEPSVSLSTDRRDLRAAVDWIKVSAQAPSRDFIAEELERRGVLEGVQPGAAPAQWRFRRDANDSGDRYAWKPWYGVAFDDSAWEKVPISYSPSLGRGEAAWYRAWLIVPADGDNARATLRLPAEGHGKETRRRVWVNGEPVEGDNLARAAATVLVPGPNLIAVKVLQGPFDGVTGEDLVEPPIFAGRYSDGKVFVSIIGLTPRVATDGLRCRIICPSGKDLGEIGVGQERELKEYGRHSLVVEDARGRKQVFPVYHLGIHFFHWGWYSAWDGTRWNGFTAGSNDYIDQLFSRLEEWRTPHHSISWCGAIFAPGTGFHLTKGVDYPAKFREASRLGKLTLVGMPFAPRNICADFGESLLRGIRRSVDIYLSVLGTRPRAFASHDSTLTPLLPQILRLTGYDTLCMVENWWGEQSLLNSRDCYWENADGSRIRVLDSPYHGIPVTNAVERAILQGKPAVFCAEEFACLDATGFLNREEWESLARRGILLKPVGLDEYRQITDGFARQVTRQGDAGLCYKGWTGGSEGETEYEKAARRLETDLVALENLCALAALSGIHSDRELLDALWDFSLRLHECHVHFGNGVGREGLTEFERRAQSARAEMKKLAEQLVSQETPQDGVTVFNPLGFRRDALIGLELPEGTRSLLALSGEGEPLPAQPDPEHPGRYLVCFRDLPSIGGLGYRVSSQETSGPGVKLELQDDGLILDNGLIRACIGPNAEIRLLEDGRTGAEILRDGHRLYFSLPQDAVPEEPFSSASVPLNLNHYVRPSVRGRPKLVCQGPVMAAADLDLVVPGYPEARFTLRVSLVRGERMLRLRLAMQFESRTVLCPVEAQDPHEGTYLPGIFCAFPMDSRDRPVADMAYCLTDDVISSTNHATFLSIPFRNGTFNALTMSGPSKGSYSVLTRGLNDFFITRRPVGMLALSFGFSTASFPYHGEYVHEYAVIAEPPGSGSYRAARSFQVDAFAVQGALRGRLSLLGLDSADCLIEGVEHRDGRILARVVNLAGAPATVPLTGALRRAPAEVHPDGLLRDGKLRVPPRSVRDLVFRSLMQGLER